MKCTFFVILFIQLTISINAKKFEFPEVKLNGIENPQSICLSPDGLRMLVVDLPKKGLPVLKQVTRSFIDQEWGVASVIEEISKYVSEGIVIEGITFSFDNKYIYFSANLPNGFGGSDLYRSEIINDDFTDPVNIGAPINTVEDERFPSVSGNNRILFFTRNVEMEKVKKEKPGNLWWSHKSENEDKWQKPEKLNWLINNGGIAYSKIYDDNQTLFYSRIDEEEKKWRIHWAKRLKDIHWYLPVKFDTLTSNDQEVSPFYCKQDSFLYFIKLSDGGRPKGEIFKYKIENEYIPNKTIEIKGVIKDSLNNIPIDATIKVTDPYLGKVEYLTSADQKSGNWKTLLQAGEQYLFQIQKSNYSYCYKLFRSNETQKDQNWDFSITPNIRLNLHIYDEEELWPLDAQIEIFNEKNEHIIDKKIISISPGIKTLQIPIGENYKIKVTKSNYFENKLELDLSKVVFYDFFVRDIELKPKKRSVDIIVVEKDSNIPLDAKIELIDKLKRKFVPEKEEAKPGFFKTSLREGEIFDIEVRGPKDYAFKHLLIDLSNDPYFDKVVIELSPLKRMVPIRLENINFEFNSAELLENSFQELERVVQLLLDNPEVYVELLAHTDDIGSDRYNDVLSNKRAKSIVDYLTRKGINSKRLVAHGYGERVPLVPNDTDENRALNRRVELKILDEKDQIFKVEEKIIDEN